MVAADINLSHPPNVVLAALGIRNSFNRVEVLHGIDFTLRHGEVHGIVGQNGAGKSTLMKIINGVYTCDAGTITINGITVHYDSPSGANKHGISMVFQEFSLIPSMTVLQNLYLAHEEK
jgi:ribose transport system ATP-binding protein